MDPIPLVGYADRFSCAPGDQIAFKVSCHSQQPYRASLVRVISCDPNPEGPGVIEHPIASEIDGEYRSRVQEVRLGSHIEVQTGEALTGGGRFKISALIWPTSISAGLQGVVTLGETNANRSISLAVSQQGATLKCGETEIQVSKPMVERRWYRAWMTVDLQSGACSVGQEPVRETFDVDDAGIVEGSLSLACKPDRVTIGALDPSAQVGHFNGKIEAPQIHGGDACQDLLAHWDFSQGISTAEVRDTGPHSLHGQVVNLPARAVKGAAWDGSVQSWQENPTHYAAIYFHDDDLYDCEWDTDFDWAVPEDLPSGVYAARLETAEGHEEMIPFFVTAPLGRPRSKVVVLIPTFTYTVYANISRGNATQSLKDTARTWGASPWNTDEHQEFGLSTYNNHRDGSGIGYSSRRRPIITMRSAVICYPDVPGSGLRHFAADGHLWYWLWKLGYDFDVITDDELHRHGHDAIRDYQVVMTCTHPEYHTTETLDALQTYTDGGGRFMYLGGNGFYWKVALSDAWPDAIEIRRGEGGIRAWAADPGEYYNAFDGEYGGLWRRNDRPPQKLCGVGFTSQGAHVGEPYIRTPASYSGEFEWMFEGIDEKVLGDFGLSGGGAAGFELDRADPKLGTPLNATVVASSPGKGEHFVLVPEDILTNVLSWNGEDFKDLIRADMVFFETANGGAVFSVGSITYCGSLPVNDCDNDISRLTRNVLDRFLSS